MLVHSLWDQEDIYGAPAVYKRPITLGTPARFKRSYAALASGTKPGTRPASKGAGSMGDANAC
jgi:hypothetical protein